MLTGLFFKPSRISKIVGIVAVVCLVPRSSTGANCVYGARMRLFGFWEASTLCYGCMVCAVYVEPRVICLPFQHFRSFSVQEICAVLVPFHFTVAKALVLFLQMMQTVCAERSKLMIIILVDDQNIDITSNNKYYQESTNHSLRMAATIKIIQSLDEAIVVDLCLIL